MSLSSRQNRKGKDRANSTAPLNRAIMETLEERRMLSAAAFLGTGINKGDASLYTGMDDRVHSLPCLGELMVRVTFILAGDKHIPVGSRLDCERQAPRRLRYHL